MEYIEKETWARREAYELFSQCDWPFYSVTVPFEVSRVKSHSIIHGLSFYHLMVWLCTKAVNSVPEFRLRVRGGDVVRLDQTNPSFTSMKPGAEDFQIITMPWEADLVSFCENARRRSEAQTRFLDQEQETDALIYFSCTPWFDFTSLTNERRLDRDDTIPRLTWGKYCEDRGRLWVHMSIEVNHRTIDGFHIGQLKEAIDREIEALG